METKHKNTAIILMHCPDKQGIVAKVTEFLDNNNGNIIYLDQHVDREEGVFFMRIEWELDNFLIPARKIADYFDTQIAAKYNMTRNIYFPDDIPKMAIFVSKATHCLYDIMSRVYSRELEVEVPLIIGNHPDLETVAKQFDVPFHMFLINKENKKSQEEAEIKLLKEKKINFVVLARYMQIVSGDFIKHFPDRIINIHHSFLPAFAGAKPYHAAYERGVKIIGATSHYVTEELDAGPIIEQDVTRISHTDSVKKLIRKGQDLEKIVLSRAIRAHVQRKTLVYKNKTIVFS